MCRKHCSSGWWAALGGCAAHGTSIASRGESLRLCLKVSSLSGLRQSPLLFIFKDTSSLCHILMPSWWTSIPWSPDPIPASLTLLLSGILLQLWRERTHTVCSILITAVLTFLHALPSCDACSLISVFLLQENIMSSIKEIIWSQLWWDWPISIQSSSWRDYVTLFPWLRFLSCRMEP